MPALSEMSLLWSCLFCPQATWSYWKKPAVSPAGRGEATLEEHSLPTAFQLHCSVGGSPDKWWGGSSEQRTGGKRWSRCTHRLFLCSGGNCKPDEEQTWLFSSREIEMAIGVSATPPPQTRDLVYSSCSAVWRCGLISCWLCKNSNHQDFLKVYLEYWNFKT